VPAPTLLIGLGIIILQSRVIPIIFGFLALAFGTVLGVLGFVGTFTPLQQVIDYVLGAQEVWFAAAGIALIVVTGKVVSSSAAKKVVSWERYKRKPEVIQLPLLGLDGDHTDADAALG
jgi:hypothetical protein